MKEWRVEPSVNYKVSDHHCKVSLAGSFIGDMPNEWKNDVIDTIEEVYDEIEETMGKHYNTNSLIVDTTEITNLSSWGNMRIRFLFRKAMAKIKRFCLIIPPENQAMCGGLAAEISAACSISIRVYKNIEDSCYDGLDERLTK